MTKISAKYFTVAGMILQIATLLGVVLAAIGLLQTFSSLAAEGNAAGGATSLAEGVSRSLAAMIATRPLGLLGLVLIAVGIGWGGLRDRWVFRWACICMIPWVLSVGIGTVIGLVGLLVLFAKRKEFGAQPGGTDNSGAAPLRV